MKSWHSITKKYIGVPYKFGSWKIEKGLDCLAFLVLMMQEQGYTIDWNDSIGGFTKETYVNLSDEDLINQLLYDYICKNTVKLNLYEYQVGDIVFIEVDNKIVPGILDGNAKVLTCSRLSGVILLSNMKIIEARRWI